MAYHTLPIQQDQTPSKCLVAGLNVVVSLRKQPVPWGRGILYLVPVSTRTFSISQGSGDDYVVQRTKGAYFPQMKLIKAATPGPDKPNTSWHDHNSLPNKCSKASKWARCVHKSLISLTAWDPPPYDWHGISSLTDMLEPHTSEWHHLPGVMHIS